VSKNAGEEEKWRSEKSDGGGLGAGRNHEGRFFRKPIEIKTSPTKKEKR